MDYTQKISERHWNLPDKGEREAARKQTFLDDIILHSHIEKELLSSLEGITTVFDGGGGCGRFSILLAGLGCQVTHFDISQPMLDKAAQLATQAGVAHRITFVKGALEDLSAYPDNSFDLVMSFDAPISYTWPNQESVIAGLVRICNKKILLSVSSRLGSLPYLSSPLDKSRFLLTEDCGDAWAQWCISNYQSAVENFTFNASPCTQLLDTGLLGDGSEVAEYEAGGSPWPITYTFLPEELERILRQNGVREISLAGPGTYARTLPPPILRKILQDPSQKSAFLDFCHTFDQHPSVCGLGKDNLFAKGVIAQ